MEIDEFVEVDDTEVPNLGMSLIRKMNEQADFGEYPELENSWFDPKVTIKHKQKHYKRKIRLCQQNPLQKKKQS
jgi:hypothetical protein